MRRNPACQRCWDLLVSPSLRKALSRDLEHIPRDRLVMGIADGTMAVDGREIYAAKDLRVGLFTSTEGF